MDVDTNSRPGSSGEGFNRKGDGQMGEGINSRGKVVISGTEEGFCKPGQDCEDCS